MRKVRVKRHAVTQPLDTSYRFIPLTRNQNAIVDEDDFERLAAFNWAAHWSSITHTFYAERWAGNGKHIKMHRFIMNAKEGEKIDHRSHDTLDNRKENLRQAGLYGNAQNARIRSDNPSGFRGVSRTPLSHVLRWRARIHFRTLPIYVGEYSTPEQAARAYDEAAKKYHGEFAHLNFPDE